MTKKAIKLNLWAVVTCFVLGATWWITFRVITGLTLEDALITFRYSQNLASGNGFVYNTGQRVLGTTTPLLTLFLGAVGRFLDPAAIPPTATLTMACFGILTGITVYQVLAALRFSLMTRMVSIFLFFGNELILTTSVGGMETPLVLFLMAASSLALLRRQPTACLLISALLVLTRPDGIIWAAIMSLVLVRQSKEIPWNGFLVAACVVLPWLLFATWYFGSPLPHSVVAKRAIGAFTDLPPQFSFSSLTEFTKWYLGSSGLGAKRFMIPIWMVVLALGAVSYLSREDRRGFGSILIGFTLVYALFLYVGRAPFFSWYLAPPLLCSVLLISPGITELSRILSERVQTLSPRLKTEPAIVAAVLLCAVVAQNRGIVRDYFEHQENELHTRRAIGLWLQNNTPRESVVAMEAVGYQGYYSQRTIIDLAGLVSPRVVAIRRETASNAGFFFKVLSTLEPDYVVLRSFEVDENKHFHGGRLFETEEHREYFNGNYRELRRFTAPYPKAWGRLAFLTIYVRCAEGCGQVSRKALGGN